MTDITEDQMEIAMRKSLLAQKLYKKLMSPKLKEGPKLVHLEKKFKKEIINTLKRQGIIVDGNRG